MNNPINLAIGVAVLCCSFSCATSFTNTGLGDISGGAGGLVTGAGGAAVDAAAAATAAVTGGGGSNLQQASQEQECEIKCDGCNFPREPTAEATIARATAEGASAVVLERLAWCLGEGSNSSKTKFGNPCCLPGPPPPPPPPPAEIAEGTMPTGSSHKGPKPEGAAPAGGFKGEIEGYKIRKRVI